MRLFLFQFRQGFNNTIFNFLAHKHELHHHIDMVRRNFFARLGAILFGITFADFKSVKTNTHALKTDDQDKVFRFSKTKPYSFNLSPEEVKSLKELRDSYRSKNKLVSITSVTAPSSSMDLLQLEVIKVFDTKKSRDEYVEAFAAILSNRKLS